MERDNNKKKNQKKEKLLLQSSDECPKPLQDFNRIPRRNNTTKNFSSSSSSSKNSSISIEVPKCCLGFLLSSSNSNPSSSSSSRSHLRRKPKSFSKITNKPLLSTTSKSAPNSTRPRSKHCKENDLTKPSSQNSKKNPSFLSHWHSGKKPTSKDFQRSKLSSALVKNLENPASGSERFGVNQKDLKQRHQEIRGLGEPPDFNFNVLVVDNSDNVENFTPAGKLACGPSLNYAIVDDKPVEEDSNSANSTVVKTPPVEASVSPEIQCGSSNIVLSSTVTPVCYGAAHLVSGVTDKRKCRPRGILTVGGPMDSSGCGKISVCKDYSNENADDLINSRTSLIPLPAEASMRWLLSSQAKEDDFNKDDNASAYRPSMDSASVCVSSSPSSCCQFPSDLVSDSGERNGNCSPDAITSTGKTRIVLLSPKSLPNFQGFSEISCGKYGDSSVTLQASFSCKTDNMEKGGDCSYGFIGEKTPSSVDPLSSSNILQTPTSDSSQDRHVGISWIDEDDCQRNEFNPELCSAADIFHRTSVSPRSQMPVLDPPGLSSQFTNLTSSFHSIDHMQLQKNLDNCASWISDSTVGNMSLSQMRISWREGLVSRICDIDELDCCRCLSDEEKNGERSDEFQHKSPKAFGMREHDSFRIAGLRSPEFLEEEPEILRKGKKASSPVRPNICAESICTDAGGLVASEDSDWALCYKNQLFEV